MPTNEAIAFLPLPIIAGPAFVTSAQSLQADGFQHQEPTGEKLAQLLAKHGATSTRLVSTIDPFPFCAMLLKVALSFAHYERLDTTKYELYAAEIIRNDPGKAWRYVASNPSPFRRITQGMHSVALLHEKYFDTTYLTAVVTLFSRHGAAGYQAILGKPLNQFIAEGPVVVRP